MRIEIFFLGVIVLALILDFVLRGIKKKSVKGIIERIEGEKYVKILSFNYFKKRPRNTVAFTISVLFFKILFHYFLYPEYSTPGYRWNTGWVGVNSQKKSFSYHIDNLFVYDVWLFIPTILFLALFVWYFNDKIKAR